MHITEKKRLATMPSDEVESLLRMQSTAAAGCRAVTLRCLDGDGRQCAAESGLLENLLVAVHSFAETDSAVAKHGCMALVSLCRPSADEQARAAALGALVAAAACARAHPRHFSQACAAVEALCTGKGAAARRAQAVDAGWLPLLVHALGEEDGEDEVGGGKRRYAARAALRAITRDSIHLHQAALDAGGSRHWLL